MAPKNHDRLTFTVTRSEHELIRPSEPTPRDYKRLSDIDDQEGLRFQLPVVQFYPHGHVWDPAPFIGEGLAKALVYYYPFAGRLRELPGRKLVVDCTGEGVIFIEADADVTLEEFGDALQPPFPCFDELLFDVPGSSDIVDTPLLLIQLTRLNCGGFILAVRMNHAMCDAQGLVQFLNAVGELARGASVPSILPVWRRELLEAGIPPEVTYTHHEYDDVPDAWGTILPFSDLSHRSFFIPSSEIANLRRSLPLHLHGCTAFEIITACLWRCRTIALDPDPEEEMRMLCIVNCRNKLNPPLPKGYYGNAIVFPAAITTAGKLSTNPLAYALDLIKKAKACATEEYVKSVLDLLVDRGRPHFTVVRSFIVSNLAKVRPGDIDFGWGKPIYSGPAVGGIGAIPGTLSFYIPYKNGKGEEGMVVPMCLPAATMDRFEGELNAALGGDKKNDPADIYEYVVSRL
ncbi:hypothetical protein MLD38_035440 [Melastoma candidum]|uniref:Uncharacterized protein n=1 Tax=Melastoma candidum TaxID=119954 RepID=A0ACB9LH03_9MYRT|nr:hypothetical protein MLD38_035440 [Melastoma candidum]